MLLPWCFMNCLSNFIKTDGEYLLAPTVYLVRFWRSGKQPHRCWGVEVHLLVDVSGRAKLEGCIVLNEHNAVFTSKQSAICNRCFPGATRVLHPNGISIASAACAWLTRWQTDRPRYSVDDNRRSAQYRRQILLLSTATTSIYWSSRLDRWISFSNQQLYSAIILEGLKCMWRHTTI